MKALPLWQPWATLVAVGAKRVETRAYQPQRLGLRHGQRIAIHATKTTRDPDTGIALRTYCDEWPFSEHTPDWDALPLGALVATCTLSEAHQITQADADALAASNPQERAFGDYTPGRWAWILTGVRRLPTPVPFTGSQGTFDVPDERVGHAPAISVDCSYPQEHASQHHPHPTNPRPGRLVCFACHPPAASLPARAETRA